MSQQKEGNLFVVKKAQWRMRVKTAVIAADEISARHNRGKHISMGELYEAAHRLSKLGNAGETLRGRMDEFGVKQRQRIHDSIAATCQLVESATKVLELITSIQGTPLVGFPVYVSDLDASAEVETDALEAFEMLKKEVEGENN